MQEVLAYVVLGLGPGAVNALLGLGLVTVYRGSGVLNFGHAAVAMYVAFVFRTLRQSWDWPTPLAVAGALVVAAVLGLLIHLLVMHPLRHAPTLARVTGSLGVLLVLASLALLAVRQRHVHGQPAHADDARRDLRRPRRLGPDPAGDRRGRAHGGAVAVLPAHVVRSRDPCGRGEREGGRRHRLLAGASCGHQLDDRQCARRRRRDPDHADRRLNALQLSLLIAPALAAALLGRFENLWLVLAGGMVLGVGETVIGKYLNGVRGLTATLPFLLIVLVLIVKGSALPQRGELVYSNMPLAPPVHRVPAKVAVFAAVSVLLLFWLPSSYSAAFSIALLGGVIILSLVVIVGWVGQISLCQVGFTGIGAYATIRIANHLSIGFPFSIVLGALVAVPIGVLVGLPALRVRGVNLAVVTLGAGIALERMVFNNPSFTGGSDGSAVPRGAELFGVDLDGRTEPARFGVVILVVLCVCVLLLANLRRSVSGRRMLAVRADETAAAASGINVAKVKLQAFALSAFVAALAGGLMAYRAGRVSESGFVVFQSINFFSLAYIGGIATIGGALVGTLLAPGAPGSLWLRNFIGSNQVSQTVSGVGLIVTVITQPDGVANVVRHEREKRRMKAARAALAAGARDTTEVSDAPTTVSPVGP